MTTTTQEQGAVHHTATVPVTFTPTENMLRNNSEFLIMLAHELRNPLSPILYSLHLIEENSGENVLLRNAQLVLRRQINHTTRVIDNLLDVSKMLLGTLKMHRRRISLATIIEGAIEYAKASMESRKHRFTYQIPEDPIWLNADPHYLSNAISSLLLNAAKFTETSGKISLTANYNDGRVVITIKDNGIGIDRAQIAQIFELFTQTDQSQKLAHGGGLGIGLTLVRGIVAMHEGNVEAFSEGTGKGSEFVITMPVQGVGGDAPEPVEPIQPVARRKNLEVLVVDDHIDTAESTAIILKSMGHTVRLAHSGNAAVEMAHVYSPDVVLLDIGLPGMDGYQAAKLIRQEIEGVLLVAISGYGQEIDMKRSAQAGFDKHLVKPVNPQLLPDILNTVHQGK
jgi:CheY-like chemotaxis protein